MSEAKGVRVTYRVEHEERGDTVTAFRGTWEQGLELAQKWSERGWSARLYREAHQDVLLATLPAIEHDSHKKVSLGGLERLEDLLRQYHSIINPLLHEVRHMATTTQDSALLQVVSDVLTQEAAFVTAMQAEIDALKANPAPATDDPAVTSAIGSLQTLVSQMKAGTDAAIAAITPPPAPAPVTDPVPDPAPDPTAGS